MRIIQRLYSIDHLPVLPEVILHVQQLLASDEGDARQLAALIEQDISLSARVLQIANSVYFKASDARISSVQRAVAHIGFVEVANIVTTLTLLRTLPLGVGMVNYKEFWRHCLTAAYVTRAIANASQIEFSPADRAHLFVAGLMHDVGILVYDQFFNKEFKVVVDTASRHGVTYLETEQLLMGNETHAIVGSALLELWKMAIPVVSAVRFHHNPSKSPEKHRALTSVVSVAEFILCNWRIGSFEGSIPEIDESILAHLGISASILPDLCNIAITTVSTSDLILSMDQPRSTESLKPV
jgi:HD-like signal output (HDOD) protein